MPERRTLGWIPRGDVRLGVMRVEIYVRPNSSRSAVGGDFDGALVVRVTEPADAGRATEAALRALAVAVQVPRRSVSLVRGAKSRRKIVDVETETDDSRRVQAALARLHATGEA